MRTFASFTFMLLTICPVLANAGDIDDAPLTAPMPPMVDVPNEKSEILAAALAGGGTAAAVAVIYLDEGDHLMVAAASMAVLPSLGHFYAGDYKTALVHTGVRSAILLGTTAAASAEGSLGGTIAISLIGLGGVGVSAVWSIIDAPLAARRENEHRRLLITPAALPGVADERPAYGLQIAGAF